MSMVNMAELELKMEVSEDMRAASMTASRSPLNPTGNVSFTNLMKAMLVQPDLKYQCFFPLIGKSPQLGKMWLS